MGNYYSIRIWQLKPGRSAEDLEIFISSGYLEMQRWIPGVTQLSLVRLAGETAMQYLLSTTFFSYEAYMYWRQVEEEAPDYWERYAAMLMQLEQFCFLVTEYAGEAVLDIPFSENQGA